ncbi:MAG: 50S ribosomal protein L22 [Candidatus Pacebacteria bacterium]|nr:50S ribosomal protein L22 [Candidatus Paceibacterota bacterium]
MQFKVTQKNTRQTPRKVRLVANTIKDLPLDQAIKQLAIIERRATLVLLKTIKQAIANAKNNHGVDASKLAIKEILVNPGPTYKRFNPVSRGRAHSIMKRTCHITVTLEEKTAKTEEKAVIKAEKVAKEAKKEEKKSVVKKATSKKAVKKTTTKKETVKTTTKKQ